MVMSLGAWRSLRKLESNVDVGENPLTSILFDMIHTTDLLRVSLLAVALLLSASLIAVSYPARVAGSWWRRAVSMSNALPHWALSRKYRN